jgi:hypothetical protein
LSVTSFSNEEYLEIAILYGQCDRNAAAAARREYTIGFPDRRHPDNHVILKLLSRIRETGSVMPVKKGVAGAPRQACEVEVEEAVLELLWSVDPRRSVRVIARMVGSSKSTTHSIIQEQQLHPFQYHYTRVQQLQEADYPRRIGFCR